MAKDNIHAIPDLVSQYTGKGKKRGERNACKIINQRHEMRREVTCRKIGEY